MDLVSLVSKSEQRIDFNVLRNRLSRYETMACGIPKCTLCCDALLAGNHNRHLRKVINNYKNIITSPLGGWKAKHVFH
jgi:hypothetical protein